MGDKDRNAGTVFGITEDLPGLVSGRVEIDFRLLEYLQLVGLKIIPIVRTRKKKRCERKEHFGIVLPSGERADRAEGRQRDFADKGAVELVDFEQVVNIVHISDDKVVVNKGNIIEYIPCPG